jgi:hypothetical protein
MPGTENSKGWSAADELNATYFYPDGDHHDQEPYLSEVRR